MDLPKTGQKYFSELSVLTVPIKRGLADDPVEAFGQTLPAIMTADGVAEAGNGRVEILLGVK